MDSLEPQHPDDHGVEQLRLVQKLDSLGLLAGGIAHDFNNLLTGILGNAELALLELPADARCMPLLQSISESAVKAASLCRQMLAFAGRATFHPGPMDLRQLLLDMDQLLRLPVPGGVALRIEGDEHGLTLHGDLGQIQQLIMNLVTNAAEAIGSGAGSIELSLAALTVADAPIEDLVWPSQLPPGRYAQLTVEDSGHGIEATTRARLFEPYFTTRPGHRGLGLAVALGIVKAHEGGLCLTSALGVGTRIRALFPLVAEPLPHPSPRPKAAAPCGEGPILLVDDEEHVREVARLLLERQGHEVLAAASGREALDLVKVHGSRLSLAILDLAMPDLCGDQLFLQLREHVPDLSAILCSGFQTDDLAERFADLGFAGFLQKPYRAAALRECVASVIAPAIASQGSPSL